MIEKLFEWELIDNCPHEYTSRAKVPGGWIVVHGCNEDNALSESMVVIPDPDHIWTVNKEKK